LSLKERSEQFDRWTKKGAELQTIELKVKAARRLEGAETKFNESEGIVVKNEERWQRWWLLLE